VSATDSTPAHGIAPTGSPGVAVGVLLAGGESRRMGRDKRALRLDGSSLVERNVAFLRSLFPSVAISVRDRAQLDAAFGGLGDRSLPTDVEVLCDKWPGSPLGGIATALTRFDAPVFALAADIAFADRDAVTTVLQAFRDTDVALPVVSGHLEPLHAAYGEQCLPVILRLLEAGRHSILDLFPEVRVATVPFESARPFFNVNTPRDWEDARRRDDGAVRPQAGVAGQPDANEGRPAVLAVVGRWRGGRTRLLELLIPELKGLGLRVGTVQQVTDFDIDHPGKDSWRHGQAGATAYAVGSPAKLAYVERTDRDTPLGELVTRFFPGFDLVLCEGCDEETLQVIEVCRAEGGRHEPVIPPDRALAAVADIDIGHAHRFDFDEAPALARFIVRRLGVAGQTDR